MADVGVSMTAGEAFLFFTGQVCGVTMQTGIDQCERHLGEFERAGTLTPQNLARLRAFVAFRRALEDADNDGPK